MREWKMRYGQKGWNMQEWKSREQIAGLENAAVGLLYGKPNKSILKNTDL